MNQTSHTYRTRRQWERAEINTVRAANRRDRRRVNYWFRQALRHMNRTAHLALAGQARMEAEL